MNAEYYLVERQRLPDVPEPYRSEAEEAILDYADTCRAYGLEPTGLEWAPEDISAEVNGRFSPRLCQLVLAYHTEIEKRAGTDETQLEQIRAAGFAVSSDKGRPDLSIDLPALRRQIIEETGLDPDLVNGVNMQDPSKDGPQLPF